MLRPEDHFPPADRFARKKASDIEQRNIIAGAGLTEGGDLSSDVTLNVGAGEGIVVNPDDVAIDIPAETARVEALIAAANLQPADSDLTAIAALTTTAFGRALLTLADAGALRAAAALGTAALNNTEDFQAADSDLAAIAALATTAYGRGLLTLADQAAHKAALDLTGTNSGDQTSIVGITGTLAQFNTAITDADIMPTSGGIFSGDITVPAEAYGVGWNGSNEVPTKNDLYDKIETISAGSIPDPYVPADGTMNITGAVTATGKVTGAILRSTDARLLERADSNWVVYNNGGEIWFSAFGFGTYHFWNDALSATIFSIANTGTITCAGSGTFAGNVTAPNIGYSIVAKNATYTEATTSGEIIILASGTFTINLPTAVGNTAKFHVKLVAAGTVTIDPNGAQTIDGSATAAISTLNAALTFISDNANWQII